MSGKVIYFQEQLFLKHKNHKHHKNPGKKVFSPNDVNSKFLSTFVIKFEASIPYTRGLEL